MNKNIITTTLAAILLIGSAGMACAHFTMVFPSDSEATVWDVTPEDYIAGTGRNKDSIHDVGAPIRAYTL
jgi:cobalt/nickel transport protein